MNMNR